MTCEDYNNIIRSIIFYKFYNIHAVRFNTALGEVYNLQFRLFGEFQNIVYKQ
jgi:hypothetical protein